MKPIDVLKEFAGPHAERLDQTSVETFANRVDTIIQQSDRSDPVEVVIAGFPAKSPNTSKKVMGTLPDFGEYLALGRLARFRDMFAEVINKDVALTICSDGHIFSDIKEIPDTTVDTYRNEIQLMATSYGLAIRGLGDYINASNTPAQRELFVDSFVEPVNVMRSQVLADDSMKMLYDNLRVFAERDLKKRDMETKRDFKTRACVAAFDLLSRSNGWSKLIKEFHPNAVRLSVHPYTEVSEKFPFMLLGSYDGRWRTPWHNVPIAYYGSRPTVLAPRCYADKSLLDQVDRSGRFISTNSTSNPWTYVETLN